MHLPLLLELDGIGENDGVTFSPFPDPFDVPFEIIDDGCA